MFKSIYKKVASILIISLVFILCRETKYAIDIDFLDDVNLVKLDGLYNRVTNYGNKEEVHQNELYMDKTGTFSDLTPIRNVRVVETDVVRKNRIAITFDDNFTDMYTKDLLDVLDKHNCKATFFITSTFLDINPGRIFEIIKRGHEIGNHTMTHTPLKKLHAGRLHWEVVSLQLFVKELTGIDMTLFRFPTGTFDGYAVNAISEMGLYPVNWSIDSDDWKLKNKEKILNRIMSQKVHSGDIVLMHNGYPITKATVDAVLTYYEQIGYSFIKLSDLLYTRKFDVKEGVQYKIENQGVKGSDEKDS